MTLAKLKIPGGIIADRTSYSTGPAWEDGSRVRFQQGQLEPIGGWLANTTYDATNGVPSKSKVWRDNSDNDCMAIGTNSHLYLVQNTILYDITPIDRSVVSTESDNAVTTASGDATVTIRDQTGGGHNASLGDWVEISGVDADIDGLDINGVWQIATVPSTSTWTFEHTGTASGTSSNDGGTSIVLDYYLGTGASIPATGIGWGADVWGENRAWGDAGTATSTSLTTTASLWSFANFGEDLVACRRGGKLYHWDASVGTGTRAATIANAPATNLMVMVTTPDRHLVSIGAHDGAADDWINVAWADQETLTTWTPSSTNTAGSQRLPLGDRLIAYSQTRDQTAIWTNKALFSMVFRGPPFTFGFRHLSTDCDPISQNAAISQESSVFWMGRSNFHVFDGAEQILACPVRDYVFDDINDSYKSLVFGGQNLEFTEIWWFYPSAASNDYPDKYVTFNWTSGEWSVGAMSRVTWNAEEAWRNKPFTFGSDGAFYDQETGLTANGSALNWSAETSTFEIPEAGDDMFFIDRWVPDIEDQTGDITFTAYYRKYPRATESNKTFTISTSTSKFNKRIRGRQLRLKYSATATSSFAKIGDMRVDFRKDGQR